MKRPPNFKRFAYDDDESLVFYNPSKADSYAAACLLGERIQAGPPCFDDVIDEEVIIVDPVGREAEYQHLPICELTVYTREKSWTTGTVYFVPDDPDQRTPYTAFVVGQMIDLERRRLRLEAEKALAWHGSRKPIRRS